VTLPSVEPDLTQALAEIERSELRAAQPFRSPYPEGVGHICTRCGTRITTSYIHTPVATVDGWRHEVCPR